MSALTEYNDEIKAKYLKEIAALEAENARLKEQLVCIPGGYSSVEEYVSSLQAKCINAMSAYDELREAAAWYCDVDEAYDSIYTAAGLGSYQCFYDDAKAALRALIRKGV